MAVYGNQLMFFAEQFRMFDYFTMNPQTVASYSKRESLGKVKGVFQYMKRGELLRENDTLADTNVPSLWTRQKLEVGNKSLLEPLEGAWPWQHLDFGPLASRTERE